VNAAGGLSVPNSGISVDVRGVEAVQKMLARFEKKEADKILQKACSAGGKVMKKGLVDAAPYPGLKKSVWLRRAKRQRPATVIGHHKKPGFYWHMVILGTQKHRIRFPDQKAAGVQRSHLPQTAGLGNIKHPGTKPNPFVARAYEATGVATMHEFERVIDEYLNQIAGA
jgi:hypothetical protein